MSAVIQNEYTQTDTTTVLRSFTFPYLKTSDIKVSLDGVETTAFTLANATTIQFNTAPNNGAKIKIFRETSVDNLTATFYAGSAIKSEDLNDNFTQNLYKTQEVGARAISALGGTMTGNLTLDTQADLVFEGATADAHETTIKVVDPTADRTITFPNVTGTVVTTGDTGTVATNMIATDAVTTAKILDNNVTLAKLGSGALPTDITVNSSNIVNGSIQTADIGGDQITNALIADDQLDSEHYIDGSIDNQHIADLTIQGGKLANGTVTDTQIATGTLDNRYYTETELDAGQLDNRYYTETEAEARFLRQDSSETISSGDTWSGLDSKVATTAAIDLRIIDLVDDVGGFVAIANETSFPTANPDVNNGAGTIVSIKSVTSARTPSSGTVTISNGSGSNTVTITGVTSTLPAGYGVLVETTSTLHTYTFHRLTPKATEVSTVAANAVAISAAGNNVTDINNFVDLYQISTSAPTARADSSSLQNGDLWFDSSSNKVLMIYDGSSGDGFTAATPNASDLVNINIVAGQLVYQEDLGLITNAINTGSGNNSVNTVATNINNVNTVANDLNEGTSEIETVGTNIANVNNVGNSISNVNTVAGSISNVNAVAGNATNINNVAADATDIGAVAGKATEIGRLGTADAVADLAILGTTDAVSDMNTLATSAIVSDMDTLADISSNITTVAGISSNVTAVAGNATNINAVQANATNINAVAGNNSNITAVAGNASNINSAVSNASNINSAVSNATNINTVAASIGDVNRYAAEYVIQSGTPSSPSTGDLWYNSTSNVLNYYNGSAFVGISPGIAGLINDASPALANHLDCNDKNLTEVGTVSGNNLQIDFGSIA